MAETGAQRRAAVERRTKETSVEVELSLDGAGAVQVDTGIGLRIIAYNLRKQFSKQSDIART